MGPVRFDIKYVRLVNAAGIPVAIRLNPNETFKDRANDPIFVFPALHSGEYIRFRLDDPESRVALRDLRRIGPSGSPASTDDIRVDNGSFAQLNVRRQLGLSIGTNDIFSHISVRIEDAGADSSGIGVHIPLSEGGGPGGDDWVVEC